MRIRWLLLFLASIPCPTFAQALSVPWTGYAHDPQHTAVSATNAQSLSTIHWSVSIDQNSSGLPIHYGSPAITAANTVLVPVKTGLTDSFQVAAHNGATGTLVYTLPTDYSLPPHDWTPPYSGALSLGTRYYYPGAGGTVYYRDSIDSPTGPNGQAGATGQIAFYGNAVYAANSAAFDSAVMISTPLVADRFGNVYFGFIVLGSNPANLTSGIARVAFNGAGTWTSAPAMAGGDSSITQVALNCAPALSNDQRTLYVAVSTNDGPGTGYLVSMDSATLAPIANAPLFDPRGGMAIVTSNSSAAPLVGPDGDVYYGVLEADCCSHNNRGWMLHFDSSLSQTKTPGSFGWDDTASIVSANLVPSYHGTSPYLILTKYNNYAGHGTGDGVNKVAILDPDTAMQDEYSTIPVQVMQEVITVTGLTPEPQPNFPNAVTEWCINSAAIDPFSKSAIVNNEDGFVYRWDFTSNTLSQVKRLTAGVGEAYTPTLVGPDGTAYAINDAVLFAIGN